MRSVVTPVLAVTAIIATALAPRVFANTHAPEVPAAPQAVVPSAPSIAHSVPSDGLGPAINVQLDRDAVMSGGIVRAELTLETPQGVGEVVQRPTDVVLVLDTSGSMSGQKLADAKTAALSLIDQLGTEDRVALVGFSSTARVDVPLSFVGKGRSGVRPAIQRLKAGGGTNMQHGMEVGRAVLSHQEGRAQRVVLLSDGHPNDRVHLNRLAQEFAGMEVPFTTVGIGADYDPQLLQQLADAGTGNFYWAGPGMALGAIFADEFRASQLTVARGTRVQGRLPAEAEITSISGFQVHNGSASLGDLFSGQRRTLYVDIHVASVEGDLDLGALELSWTQNDGTVVQRSVALGEVQVTKSAQVVAKSLDAGTWERSVLQEEYNGVRNDVSIALANGHQQQAKELLRGYIDNNMKLNEYVGSAAVAGNLDEARALEQQVKAQAIQGDALIELSTKSYQGRRSGQALSY